jgi:hypothetical protein
MLQSFIRYSKDKAFSDGKITEEEIKAIIKQGTETRRGSGN